MGNYKNSEELKINEYGEAIIEIRTVYSINPWFRDERTKDLNKDAMVAKEREGKFLTQPDNLKKDAMVLFTFLKKFSSIDKMGVFFVGLIKSLRNY